MTSEFASAHVLSRHADVAAALVAPALSSAVLPRSLQGVGAPALSVFRDVLQRQLDLSDGPAHTARRAIIRTPFAASAAMKLRPFIDAWIEDRLARLPESFDLVADFASPLPLAVTLELVGVPGDRRHTVAACVNTFVSGLSSPAAAQGDARRALDVLADVMEDAIGRADLASGSVLAAVRAAGSGVLTRDDVIANAILIVAAGHHTTAHLIATACWLLLGDGGRRARLAEDDSLWGKAIEEVLRLECPVQQVRRVGRTPVVIGDHHIEAGEEVVLMIGAANRDPDVFRDPEQCLIDRAPNPHLAFGGGPHACLGAPLARLQALVTLRALQARIDVIETAPSWLASAGYRGLQRLLVRQRR